MRFGQKGRVCHRWFTRGQRPPGLCDQRYTWAHLFAAVRPATGASFALVLPHVSTGTMQLFLGGFSSALAPDEHAAMVVDGAGRHIAHDLRIPGNVTLVFLPPYSPEPSKQCFEASGTRLAVPARAPQPPPTRGLRRHCRCALHRLERAHPRATTLPDELPLPEPSQLLSGAVSHRFEGVGTGTLGTDFV
ncbi:transposase [Muricoccus pecuniae]|uniref:transposase n=1 Tax=Muricoccus pecuniae TaxID=693023 RepID=UPI0016116E18